MKACTQLTYFQIQDIGMGWYQWQLFVRTTIEVYPTLFSDNV